MVSLYAYTCSPTNRCYNHLQTPEHVEDSRQALKPRHPSCRSTSSFSSDQRHLVFSRHGHNLRSRLHLLRKRHTLLTNHLLHQRLPSREYPPTPPVPALITHDIRLQTRPATGNHLLTSSPSRRLVEVLFTVPAFHVSAPAGGLRLSIITACCSVDAGSAVLADDVLVCAAGGADWCARVGELGVGEGE